MTWLVNIHHDAAKQLKAIPPDRRQRILDDINELAEDPFRGLVKPLKGKQYPEGLRPLPDHLQANPCDADRRGPPRAPQERRDLQIALVELRTEGRSASALPLPWRLRRA